jgi:hypothetical protein
MHFRILTFRAIHPAMVIVPKFLLGMVLAPLLLAAAPAVGQEAGRRSDPSVNQLCPECGIVYEILEIRRERPLPRTDRPLPVGPTLRFSLGDKADHKPHVDIFGNRSMREQAVEKYYEVVIRFDDNRWGRLELPDVSRLKVGDRVHVHDNRIEPDDSER